MLFNSTAFLLFFPLVTALYFLLPHRFRWFLLLGMSCFFYMFFKPEYILILFFTIVIDYYAGLWLERTIDPVKKKRYLIMSLVANIGVLAVFKYYNFLNGNVTSLATLMGYHNPIPYLKILLPIGLSFHTFQAMSYTIEVYRGNQKAEQHFGIYALYVMFYPQLVAGPIERPQNVLHQFYERHSFNYNDAVRGLNYIAFGLFKKIVIADRLSPYVNEVYADVTHHTTIPVLLAMLFFSIQIYCDFSGYSDIAIGTARIMGFHLMQNFNFPYRATSIAEFWSRWHISLSTWFRDYLYIPLGGNRVGKWKWYRNLAIVFVVSGLWHGASWNFIIWGGLHAFFLIFGIITLEARQQVASIIGLTKLPKLNHAINLTFTFLLVTFAWVFFRASTFHDSLLMLQKVAEWKILLSPSVIAGDSGIFTFAVNILLIGIFTLTYYLPRPLHFKSNAAFCLVIFILILIFGNSGTGEFIYFQF